MTYIIENELGQLIAIMADHTIATKTAEALNSHYGQDRYFVRHAVDLSKRLERELTEGRRNRYWTVQLSRKGEVVRAISKDTPNLYCRINRDRLGFMYAYMEARSRSEAIARAKYMKAHFWDHQDKIKGVECYGVEYEQDDLNKIKAEMEE